MVATVASAVFAIVYLDQSSELAEKSQLIQLQQEEILAARDAVETQRQELGARNAELSQLQSQLNALAQELNISEQSLRQESNYTALL